MTDQEQRIALCEWMGWKRKPIAKGSDDYWHDPKGVPQSLGDSLLMLPNTGSLDVLHEMWCKLNKKEHAKFRLCLEFVVQRDGHIYGPCKSLSNASSSQRREALLRTLNLWKETCPEPAATAQ